MKSYAVPSAEGLTPQEAETAAHKLAADVRGDSGHPLVDSGHPQHGDFTAAQRALVSASAPEGPAPEPLSAGDRATVEQEIAALENTPGFASGALRRTNRQAHDSILRRRAELYESLAAEPEQEQQTPQEAMRDSEQAARREQAAEIADRLVRDFDYRQEDLPDEIESYHLEGLRMQLACERRDWSTLGSMLQNAARDLGFIPEARDLLARFSKLGIDDEQKGDVAAALVRMVYNAGEQQAKNIKLAAGGLEDE